MTADEFLPVMLWYARPDMSCERVNGAWLDFTGYTEEQAQGDGWSRVVHAEDLARWLDTCLRAFDAHAPFEIEYRMRRHDGAYRWVLDRGVPRFLNGVVFTGFVGSCVDIHERRCRLHALERSLARERRLRAALEQAGSAKEDFLSSVLAQLEPAARAIAASGAQLEAQAQPGSETATALECIVRSARSQQRVLSTMLELSRASCERRFRRALEAPLLSGVRVLVVEDDADTRAALLKVLALAGAQTRTAASSMEALELLDAWRPDVMLSDPGAADGEDYLLIRGRPRPGARIAGYDAQLAKPVEPVALLATVARLAQPA